ncbi:hypothetical protein LIER_23419 [Lithospermum erythrorhizon]|uniref:Uncharacterized protein n=1 Tax=Lithospermum erythrorhizon TaxID=34254 RepID=A0AAV3R018_LITER
MIYTKAEVEKGKLKKEIQKLIKTVVSRDEKIKNLTAQLKYLNNCPKMMNSSTNILEEILVIEKNAGDSTGIGYEKWKSSNQKREVKFVPAGENQQQLLEQLNVLGREITESGIHVTFGNGGRGRIVQKGQWCVNGLPHLDDVPLVEGLTANLISIS